MPSEDITFCTKWSCRYMKCDCNPKHIKQHSIPHSYADYAGTEYCPKVKKKEDNHDDK